MTAAHEANAFGGLDPDFLLDDVADPGAARIDQHLRVRDRGFARAPVLQRDPPDVAVALCGQDLGANANVGAAIFGVAGIEHDQTRVLDPAVRILEGLFEFFVERFPFDTSFE